MKVYELQNISHEYAKNITALNNISLTIDEEPIAIIGHNGAGKTTLLKILAFLIKPKKGRIFFREKDVYKLSNNELLKIRRRICYVPQKISLFNGSVYEEIAYGLRIRKIKDIRERVRKALNALALEGLEKRKAKSLSGGMQRKLMIARAIAIEPEVFLFDEPTAEIDPDSCDNITEIIRKQVDKRRNVIVATNDLVFAKNLGFKTIMLFQGKIKGSVVKEEVKA